MAHARDAQSSLNEMEVHNDWALNILCHNSIKEPLFRELQMLARYRQELDASFLIHEFQTKLVLNLLILLSIVY